MWVYRKRSRTGAQPSHQYEVHEVGFFTPDGWEAPITCETAADAKIWVHYLNGGDAPSGLDPA
jgi:hypothetical protein